VSRSTDLTSRLPEEPVSRPPTSPSSPSSSAGSGEPSEKTSGGVPGSRALAWALVGLAALGKRKQHASERRARTDPYRARPVSSPNGAAPSGSAGAGGTADGAENGTADGKRPGEQAEAPTQIPPRGWWQVTRRAFKESSADNVGVMAGGIAYFGFISIFPALIAGLSLYGLVADPATIAQQGESVLSALPQEAQPLIRDQLTAIAAGNSGALSFSLIISIVLALWTASGGVGNLMAAINVAYDEEETRGFVKRRGTALLLTLGAIIFVLLTLALVAVIPAVLSALNLGTLINVIVQVIRWGLLIALVIVALAIVYRVAPDRDAPQFKWTSTGAFVATALWILGSIGFSLYVNNFGSYNKTYGALAGVVVLLLWLYLTSYIVLLGAEINAESEKQTQKDTTTGEPLPMGERRAEAADTVADPPEPAKK
jgi:membrane protein